MVDQISKAGPPLKALIYITCPKCNSPKAVVAAAHFGEFMCLCPKCEHVWDCPGDVLTART